MMTLNLSMPSGKNIKYATVAHQALSKKTSPNKSTSLSQSSNLKKNSAPKQVGRTKPCAKMVSSYTPEITYHPTAWSTQSIASSHQINGFRLSPILTVKVKAILALKTWMLTK